VRVDTAGIVESVRLFRVAGDSIRLELGRPLYDTLWAARVDPRWASSPRRYSGTWDCPQTVPLGNHVALAAEGYDLDSPFKGSWSLQINPVRERGSPSGAHNR
jgi:hypothetical protein